VLVVGVASSGRIDHKPLLRRVRRRDDVVEHLLRVGQHGQLQWLAIDALQVVLEDVGRVEGIGEGIRLAYHDAPHDASHVLVHVRQHVTAVLGVAEYDNVAELGLQVVVGSKGSINVYTQV